jgi:predicted flap endonuclease-1-like 5' DNA nuclease
MSWPTPQDYNEAIQNPRTCFGDEELRAGTPELTPLGLPKPISGAFASVYQMNCAKGRWAVRCFLREVSDHQARYQAISEHLQKVKLPSTVGFEFLSQGIRIRGTWYPILKMEWIDGEPLNSYIERNLANPAALSSLTGQWRDTLAALRRAEIAHGDLQHGNVLVSQGRIRLIDYDGMYVPALAGLVSHEEGHRNYQHPARDGKEFGPHLDAFSGWVVLLSLVALGVDPRMWQRLNAGDECLLFRRDDFENPADSKAFQAILAARTPELRFMARQVRSFLALPPAQVPALDSVALTLPDSRQRPAPLPDWLTHNRQAGPLEDVPSLPSLDDDETGWEQPLADSAIEHVLATADPLELWEQTDFTGERIAAATTLLVSLFLGIGALVSFVPSWLPLVVGTVLMTAVTFITFVGYRSHPYHARREAAVFKQSTLKQRLVQIEAQIQQLREDFRHATAEIRARRQAYSALHGDLRNSLAEIDARHAAARGECEREIRALEDRELDTLDEIGWQMQRSATATTQKLNQSHVDEQAELAASLAQLREKFVIDYQRQHLLDEATIEGIGPKLKERLRGAGITSAADISRRIREIEGIGQSKARQLEDWATLHGWQGETLAPKVLPPLVRGAILTKYESLRSSLSAQQESAERRLELRRKNTSADFAARRATVDRNSICLDELHDREYAKACSQFERDRQRLFAEFNELWPAAAINLAQFKTSRRKLAMNLNSACGDLLRVQKHQAQLAALTFVAYLKRMAGM